MAAERKGSSEKRDAGEEAQAQAQPRKASSKKGHKVAKLSRPVGSLLMISLILVKRPVGRFPL